jgi:hypothetical protein
MTGPGRTSETWIDLAGNRPGRAVSQEAIRRRRTEGAGADRSWRLGAEGEHLVADALDGLVSVSRLDRLRGRSPRWWVLHSVPVGTGDTDIDHVVGGPPGVITINTKHHRARRVAIEGDIVRVDGRATRYTEASAAEARRAQKRLRSRSTQAGHPELGEQLVVRPLLAVVGARLLGTARPGGVAVLTPANLSTYLRALPERWGTEDVAALFELCRRSDTWTGTTTGHGDGSSARGGPAS